MGHFYYAARAFDLMERMDPNPEYWEGKRGACAGAFQLIVAGHEPRFAPFGYINIIPIFFGCLLIKNVLFQRNVERDFAVVEKHKQSTSGHHGESDAQMGQR